MQVQIALETHFPMQLLYNFLKEQSGFESATTARHSNNCPPQQQRGAKSFKHNKPVQTCFENSSVHLCIAVGLTYTRMVYKDGKVRQLLLYSKHLVYLDPHVQQTLWKHRKMLLLPFRIEWHLVKHLCGSMLEGCIALLAKSCTEFYVYRLYIPT